MPVDLGLFRPIDEGGNICQVKGWQRLRNETTGGEEAETCDPLLSSIQAWETERRTARQRLHEQYRLLNEFQRMLSPKVSESDDVRADARSRIEILRRDTLPELESMVDHLTENLEEALPRVGNEVDTDLSVDFIEGTAAPSPQSAVFAGLNVIIDPLLSLGGYERLDDGHATILTGPGAILSRSMTEAALRVACLSDEYSHLVGSISVDASLMRALLGCHSPPAGERPSNCLICASVPPTNSGSSRSFLLEAPPVVVLSKRHQNLTYWDRQLPHGYSCTTRGAGHLDAREGARRQTFRRCKRPWFQGIHDKVEVFALTGNTMGESREVQVELARKIRIFHQSLLVNKDDRTVQHFVRLNRIPLCELLPSEASRILVEGYLPSLKAYVTLGYVSNFTDFMSRATKTKCGEEGFVHTVHGVICSVPESMEWMLQNSIVDQDGEVGIGIAPCMAMEFKVKKTSRHEEMAVFLPLRRRVQHGKGGKIIVRELCDSVTPRPLDHIRNEGERAEAMSNLSHASKTKVKEPFALAGQPTPSQISGEALSCPFDFLPMYR